MITFSLGTLRVSVPEPKHLVGSPHDVATGRGRLLTRAPVVSEGPIEVILSFPGVPGGARENGPFGAALTTTIRFRRDVQTVGQAKNDFFSDNTTTVRQRFSENPAAISQQKFEHLMVVTFNFAEAGWEPGNCVAYAVLAEGAGALVFHPTHYLQFDWANLKVEPLPSG